MGKHKVRFTIDLTIEAEAARNVVVPHEIWEFLQKCEKEYGAVISHTAG